VKLGFRTLLSILILIFAIGFYLTGFTYNITCPKCGGSGRVWSEWYDFNYHVWVQGYRKCPTCGGSGEVWMYSYISIGLMSFLAHIALFLSFFALNYMITSFHLSRNPWVKDIKQMSFWFNPAWYIWAFHTNRRKWLKWSTAIASIAAIITCVDFGLALAPTSSTITLWLHMTNRDFWIGLLIGALLLIPFSIAWYQNFEGLFTSKPSQSKETPKAFLKQCIKCGKEIPIASEECPYCGAKQKQE